MDSSHLLVGSAAWHLCGGQLNRRRPVSSAPPLAAVNESILIIDTGQLDLASTIGFPAHPVKFVNTPGGSFTGRVDGEVGLDRGVIIRSHKRAGGGYSGDFAGVRDIISLALAAE